MAASFFILVMDRDNADDDFWVFSDSAKTREKLKGLSCFRSPPQRIPKTGFVSVSEMRVSLEPCRGGAAEEGTIHGIEVA